MGFDRCGLAHRRRRAPVRDGFRFGRRPDHRPAGMSRSSPRGCTARCTSSATASTRTGSPTRCSARRSATASRSALHESQSRMWENMVGRGRAFSGVLARWSAGAVRHLARRPPTLFHRAVNKVEPSFIRVEADEATYGLHIVLRFELEQELIEGRLAVDATSPRRGTRRFKEYLGLDVARRRQRRAPGRPLVGGSDRLLPDVRARQPDRRPAVGAGAQRHPRPRRPDRGAASSRPLREWLRENVHRHGRSSRRRSCSSASSAARSLSARSSATSRRSSSDVYGVEL